MMRTYSLSLFVTIIFGLLVVSPSRAATSSLDDFLLNHNSTHTDIQKIRNLRPDETYCFLTNTHALCLRFTIAQCNSDNPKLQQGLLKILELKTKYELYKQILKLSDHKFYKFEAIIDEIFQNGLSSNNKFYLLKGIEFIYHIDDKKLLFIISIPLQESLEEIKEKIGSQIFFDDYCKELVSKAKHSYNSKCYNEIINFYNEATKLNFSNAELSIFYADALFKHGNSQESLSIANNILSIYGKKLSSKLAEHLGDIFLELGHSHEAEKAYNIALKCGG